MSSVLTATNLQKTYRTPDTVLMAVKDVSLSIDRGEVLAFLGPNGAGKTTSIKMIAGLIQPDEGSVRVNSYNPHADTRAFASIGAVLEGNRNLYWRLTPEENLAYFGVLRGLSPKVARQRGRELLDRFELSHKRKSVVQQLSRGMQQKVAIAVALVHDPALLLLDEPTLGLDVEATETVKRLIREVAAEGKGILLTTHQLDVAEDLSDRTAIINQGEIVAEKATAQLIKEFSGTAYHIQLTKPLDDRDDDRDCIAKLNYLGITIAPQSDSQSGSQSDGQRITIEDPTQLYAVLDILNPRTIESLSRDKATLTDVFLALTRKT